jgi:uncharacterized protein YceH (UPF0502 family)
MSINAEEARVLGVLVEKALTTPNQYPLSLNSLCDGCNQKNNRDPILELTQDQVFDAVETLREKGLAMRVDQMGSRVSKYRHLLAEKLQLNVREIALLAELLMRGPQTMGELRGRAGRMHEFESLEMVRSVLDGLGNRPEPLVKLLPPSAGVRVERAVQLLAPGIHPIDAAPAAVQPAPSASAGLAGRITDLETKVARLESALRRLASGLGENDPLG